MKTICLTVALAMLANSALACEPPRVPNEAVLKVLCPNKKEPCPWRDDPDAYMKTDWDLYMRITKPLKGKC